MSTEPENANSAIVIASVILAVSILGGGFLVKQSVDQAANELGTVLTAMAERPAAQLAAAPSPGRPPQGARPARPDANRVYPVTVGDAAYKGPVNAPVTIVEYSDFQCPFCRRVNPTLDQIVEKYGDKVRVAFKHLPLGMHPKAPAAHAAAAAAQRQGKFWEMHDKIFADQRGMSPEKYEQYAQEIGLDVEKFKKDVTLPDIKRQIAADTAEAAKFGVTGTPAFFVNGRFLSGAQPLANFERLIDEALDKG